MLAHASGVVKAIDALAIGLAACRLGAGRQRKEDQVDHAVGIRLHATVGDPVAAGDPLFTIYARSDEAAHAAAGEVLEHTKVVAGSAARSCAPAPVIIERRG